jgi:hypothetical protein
MDRIPVGMRFAVPVQDAAGAVKVDKVIRIEKRKDLLVKNGFQFRF